MSHFGRTWQFVLIALQLFQVTFLWLHDWLPLGRLNDVAAVRRADPLRHLIVITLLQSVPWTIGLFLSLQNFGQPWPRSLLSWLWVTYGMLFLGQLRAWWVPYLIRPEPARAERYRKMFGNTYTFLPRRNGMVPNTAHVSLHIATLATLAVLAISAR